MFRFLSQIRHCSDVVNAAKVSFNDPFHVLSSQKKSLQLFIISNDISNHPTLFRFVWQIYPTSQFLGASSSASLKEKRAVISSAPFLVTGPKSTTHTFPAVCGSPSYNLSPNQQCCYLGRVSHSTAVKFGEEISTRRLVGVNILYAPAKDKILLLPNPETGPAPFFQLIFRILLWDLLSRVLISVVEFFRVGTQHLLYALRCLPRHSFAKCRRCRQTVVWWFRLVAPDLT